MKKIIQKIPTCGYLNKFKKIFIYKIKKVFMACGCSKSVKRGEPIKKTVTNNSGAVVNSNNSARVNSPVRRIIKRPAR